ncbi:LacI family DNA-binding transcriptional regulator [Leucobacter luti]|uniref:LacI family DNA-binding transcriptional regulator n=1 Tax=Leucobacter luti TaxID=340320 RepID=UPI001C693C8B|nr:LacI family DNA-binding transcriptional regulator [Leucobacter luti]QYM75436.1 LacI family transcriptional regulator [Leucobacter luti]
MSPTTLADVARDVGVSTAAASLALNGKPGVSERTRDRVLEAAARLGYRPNPVGRALRQAKVGAIGLYLPSTAVHFGYYSEVTTGIAEALHLEGSSVTLLPNVAHGRRADAFPRVDGFILIEPHSDDPGVAEILSQNLPTVTGDRPPPEAGSPWGLVESPNEETVRLIYDRFLTAGSRRPGLLQIERVSEWSVELERGYLAWCAERGVTPRIASVSIHDTNEELVRDLADFFDAKSGCDAVFAAGDGIAMRIAGILRSLGKSLGTDVRLVSGVDSPMMAFHTPPITAIDLQPRLFGRRCAELMLDLLDSERPTSPVRWTVPSPLIPRASG